MIWYNRHDESQMHLQPASLALTWHARFRLRPIARPNTTTHITTENDYKAPSPVIKILGYSCRELSFLIALNGNTFEAKRLLEIYPKNLAIFFFVRRSLKIFSQPSLEIDACEWSMRHVTPLTLLHIDETLATGRNFRVFALFCRNSRKVFPRHFLNVKFAKVYSLKNYQK